MRSIIYFVCDLILPPFTMAWHQFEKKTGAANGNAWLLFNRLVVCDRDNETMVAILIWIWTSFELARMLSNASIADDVNVTL